MELRRVYPQIEELGYQLIAISPDTPEVIRTTVKKFKLPFDPMSDSKMDATKAFGLAWYDASKGPDHFEKLERHSGETHGLLPTPATFIIGTDAIIRFEYVNPNFRVRLLPDLMVEVARSYLEDPAGYWSSKPVPES